MLSKFLLTPTMVPLSRQGISVHRRTSRSHFFWTGKKTSFSGWREVVKGEEKKRRKGGLGRAEGRKKWVKIAAQRRFSFRETAISKHIFRFFSPAARSTYYALHDDPL